MICVEYLIYDDQPLYNRDGSYAGVLTPYGSVTHVETTRPYANTFQPRCSECTWIVPGTAE